MGTLEGKTAVVTGASRGIGAAIAERLASEGAAVGITARSLDAHPSLPGTLLETAARIEARGGRALPIRADLTNADQRATICPATRDAFGPIDILINNAAAAFYLPFDQVTSKRYNIVFELNVRAIWDLAQQVLPDMQARGRGFIVNISSVTSTHPSGPPFEKFAKYGGATLYGASKAALERISTGLAGEFADDGIVVNSLAPVAAVMTPGAEALGVVPEAARASAEPVENLAEAALALCEERAKPITGRVLLSAHFLAEIEREVRGLDGGVFASP